MEWIKIKSIKSIGKIDTWDLTIQKNSNYIANGILVHNSPTVTNLVKAINPDCFEDVVAINSINRPGPLENFGPVYGKWKRWVKENNVEELENIEHIRHPFEFMKEPLKETYGCLLYQEQFMLMVKAAAGFNMGEADSFRRAIGLDSNHPKYYTVKKYFDKLEVGMLEKGYSKEDVTTFIDYCNGFMGYSYVKCLTKNHYVRSKSRGKIKILDVEVGEEILSFNVKTKKDEYNKVKDKLVQGRKDVFEVELETGETSECTINQKFLTETGMKPLSEIISKNLSIKIK